MPLRIVAGLAGLVAGVFWTGSADAQLLFEGQRARSTTSATLNWLYNRPTVSPYVNLTRTDNLSRGAMNYQTRVRPRLEAERQNQMRQAASRRAEMQQAVSSLQSRTVSQPASGTRGRDPRFGMTPTGHPTESMSYFHYYPALNQFGGRRR